MPQSVGTCKRHRAVANGIAFRSGDSLLKQDTHTSKSVEPAAGFRSISPPISYTEGLTASRWSTALTRCESQWSRSQRMCYPRCNMHQEYSQGKATWEKYSLDKHMADYVQSVQLCRTVIGLKQYRGSVCTDSSPERNGQGCPANISCPITVFMCTMNSK